MTKSQVNKLNRLMNNIGKISKQLNALTVDFLCLIEELDPNKEVNIKKKPGRKKGK